MEYEPDGWMDGVRGSWPQRKLIHWAGENEITRSIVYDFVILDYLILEVAVDVPNYTNRLKSTLNL